MAAEILTDNVELEIEQDAEQLKDNNDAFADMDSQPSQETQEQQVPDKYQGKDLKEIVRMHQEAEKLIGKHSTEVGDLRRTIDSYITTQLSNPAPHQNKEEEQEDDDLDFFEDPKAAIQKALQNSPEFKQIRENTVETAQTRAKATLSKEHPDLAEVLSDPSFASWVQASKSRANRLVQANANYDVEAVSEILETWKDRQSLVTQTAQHQKQDRKQQLKTGSTGSAKGGNSQGGSKKIFRRSDIIRLMKEDPKRYESLSDEIMQAYADKRVR